MDNFMKLGWTGNSIKTEFIKAFDLPYYTEDPQWYDQQCVNQKYKIAVVQMGGRLDKNPTLLAAIQAFWKVEDFSHMQMFITQPNYAGQWHLDGVDRKAAINIPLWNCEVGGIDWTLNEYKGDRQKTEFTTHMMHRDPEAQIIENCLLDQVTLVKTDRWHRINNVVNDKHRVVLSIRFKSNPGYQVLRQALLPHVRT